ncbi:MAG: hypothetical protein R6U63_01145 [Longimicrobiales bacterium]
MFRTLYITAGLVTVGLVVAACGGDELTGLPDAVLPEGIVFSTTDTVWTKGDTITILLANESTETLGYNFCMGVLERWTNSGWTGVERYPYDVACIMELDPLEPGQSVFAEIVAYPFMDPGTYRFRTWIEWPWAFQGAETEIISSGFRIMET